MTDCLEAVEEAWNILKNGPKDKGFDPRSETDVVWFFCHCILEKLGTAQPIRTEYPTQIGDKIDIVVDKTVFIEVKYIIKTGRRTENAWKSRERNLKKDISKLGTLVERVPNLKCVLAVYSGCYDEKDEPWYQEREEDCKRAGIIMLPRAWKNLC